MSSTDEKTVLTVSELTGVIRKYIEAIFPSGLWVKGEARNLKRASSGHLYFVLRDEDAQLNCVMWKNKVESIGWDLEDGIDVELYGFLSVYEKSGSYNFRVDKIIPVGVGSRAIAFKQLKTRLQKEGLFDTEHKKRLPQFPRTIGVATASTGAAIRDIVNVLRRRAPYIKIILRPVAVQGDNAAPDIINAIKEFNIFGQVDLLIIGRGGGSEEDLWCFNDEALAYTIYDSELPIISAVGHEVDFSISDFVADVRAPTPSAAAEIAVKNYTEVLMYIFNIWKKGINSINNKFNNFKQRMESIQKSYGFRRPQELLQRKSQTFDELVNRLSRESVLFVKNKQSGFSILKEKLESLSPLGVLSRGYSICYKEDTSEIVSDAAKLKNDEKIITRLFKGEIESVVKKITDEA
ncbi:exodeoxyribonuclease VII large subunit [bacterium]|nr:exodeoxyribonuclease VII large subunit [bacterium]